MQDNDPKKKQISAQDFSKKVKEKYPQYKDVDDVLLAEKMVAKYPEYKDQVFFEQKKKEDSEYTAPKQKLDSISESGSLELSDKNIREEARTINPVGSAISQRSKAREDKERKQNTTPKKTRSFGSEMLSKLEVGSAQLGADFASAPEFLYEMFAAPQNFIADKLGVPALKTDSEKMKTDLGIRNNIKESYQNQVAKLREKSAQVDKKYEAGIYDSFANGDIEDGFRQLTGSFSESLPATLGIMMGGAYAKAPQLLAASTMVFGSGKNEQLKDENPDLSTNARVANAFGTGLAEGAFELIGSGSIGAAARGLIEREGKKKATSILRDGLTTFYKETLKKNPLTASVTGEGVTEWATAVSQNAVDVATGAKDKDFNIFTGSVDAFIGGAFGGTVFGGGLKGIDKIVNVQDRGKIKENTKAVFSLQTELENPNISETTRSEIETKINELVATNQELIGNSVSNIENLSPRVRAKLDQSLETLEKAKETAREISLDGSSEQTKKTLIASLKEKADEASSSINSILEGTTTELTALPLKEQEIIKRQAMEDLVLELNPDGTKDMTITDEQVVERANMLLKESDVNESQSQLENSAGTELLTTEPTSVLAQTQVDEIELEQPVVEQTTTNTNEQTAEVSSAPSVSDESLKEQQLRIIESTNPAPNDQNTWVRTIEDIKTAEEAFETAFEDGEMYPDFTTENMKSALETGEVTVYSSYPIAEGVFVSPSKMNAEDYAGGKGSKIHTKTVKLTDIAWIDEGEGQYAPISNKNPSNETTPTEINNVDGEVRLGDNVVEPTEEQATDKGSEVEETNDGGNIEETTVNRIKSSKGAEFDVTYDKNGLVKAIHSVKDGREIKKFSTNKKGKIIKNPNYSKIEADATNSMTENQFREEKKKSLDKARQNFVIIDAYTAALDFIANGGNISSQSAANETGASKKEMKWITGFKKDATLPTVEDAAHQIWDNNSHLDTRDIRNEIIEILMSYSSVSQVQEQYIFLSGENALEDQRKELEYYKGQLTESERVMYEAIEAEEGYLSELSEQEAIEYYEQLINEYEQGKRTTEAIDAGTTTVTENNEIAQAAQRTESIAKPEQAKPEVKQKPTKIQDIFNQDNIKDDLDWLDSLKIDTNNLNSTLPFLPQVFNALIDAVKVARMAGNSLSKAIEIAREQLRSEFDKSDVDNAIEYFAKKAGITVEPKVEPESKPNGTKEDKEPFEKEKGKKSVFSRIYEGENTGDLKEVIEKHGLNYKVENQELAQKKARAFVKEVGITKALQAVRDNRIKGAEKAFVYAEILDQLVVLSESTSVEDVHKIQEDYSIISDEAMRMFDEEARDSGRFISALNRIYNTSKIRYNLAKQIETFKSFNNGNIDEETLFKFNEADRKLKELEVKFKEAEEKLKIQEQELAIKNIEESIAREIKNKVSNKTKAKKIAAKIRSAKIHRPGIFSSATPASLAWDGAVELTAKTIEAGGSIADAIQKGAEYIKSTNWYKGLSKDQQNEAIDVFTKETIGNSIDNTSAVSISEDGTLRIPDSIIRDYVKQGITDINEISQRIIDDFFSNENIDIREVRDAITKYGRTINLNKDEINTKVRELKRVGKLISALEDVYNGKRPKKSGLQRDKPTQVEREMMRDLKDKMRDLPQDEADLEKSWKNALDTYKQRLTNRIEDLEKQIANKEKDKVKRESVKLDQEAAMLKQQVKDLNKTLNDLVGKPELTEEQKIERVENQLENAISSLENQIASNDLDYKSKPEKVTSDKIKELRSRKESLNKELNALREQVGLAESRRLEQAKQRVKNQIEAYKKKIAEKDFSKRESKPLPANAELQALQEEKLKWQEVFDRARYEAELSQRGWKEYAREALVGIVGIPRILMAGGEMSMVLIQGGIQTVSLALRNPKKLAKIFGKAMISIGSNAKYSEYANALKADPNYNLIKNSKLAITESDYKMEMREEAFIGANFAYGIWNSIGKGLEYASVKTTGVKDVRTIGATIMGLIRKDASAKRIPISEQWKNMNPLLAFERGNTIYMNELRKARFMDGVKMLQIEGKNEIDHKEDFKKLASAINTMTGRASIGRLENINDLLGIIFFSFKNTVSVFNQINPYFYYSLHSPNDPWNKPSVAQKLAIKDMAVFVTTTTAMLFALQAAIGDDEDGEPLIHIEKDPTSSDFMGIRIKGKDGKHIRFDPWHGMKPQVVFMARSILGKQKKLKGGVEITKRIGQGYKEDTHWDNFTRTYLENKFSPSMQLVYTQANSNIDKDGNKKFFGKEFNERLDFKPMYINSVIEIEKEDPDLYVRFLSALGFFGLNSSVY